MPRAGLQQLEAGAALEFVSNAVLSGERKYFATFEGDRVYAALRQLPQPGGRADGRIDTGIDGGSRVRSGRADVLDVPLGAEAATDGWERRICARRAGGDGG